MAVTPTEPPDNAGLSHLTEAGEVHMVDVSGKPATARQATAEALVVMSPGLVRRLVEGDLPKGDVLATVRLAGIMAAKRTPELVPLAHPVALTGTAIEIEPTTGGVRIVATVSTTDRTGVEMEALTAVTVAGLALYDMVKGVEREVTIEMVRLLSKSGGRSGEWRRADDR